MFHIHKWTNWEISKHFYLDYADYIAWICKDTDKLKGPLQERSCKACGLTQTKGLK